MSDSLSSAGALAFHETRFDVVDRDGHPWLSGGDIARALGYSRSDKIGRLYSRNAGEFTPSMSALVTGNPTSGLPGEIRIFSLRGAHLLAMFARTARAAEFRRWVLDVLEARPQATPYAIQPGQTLSAEQAQALRQFLQAAAEKLPRAQQGVFLMQGWSKLKAHFKTDYRHIPAGEFSEALSILTRHAAAQLQAPAAPTAPALPAMPRRWVVDLDLVSGQPTYRPLTDDDRIGTPAKLASAVAQGGWHFDEVLALHDACARYLRSEALRIEAMRRHAQQNRVIGIGSAP